MINNFLEDSGPNIASQTRDPKSDAKDDGYFPKETICPYMGLRKVPYLKVNAAVPQSNEHCTGRRPTEEECTRAARSYELGKMPLTCQEEPGQELCSIAETWRYSLDTKLRVRCNTSPCGTNPVYVAGINPGSGVLDNEENWKKFNTTKELQEKLPEIVIRQSRNGFPFCFIHCLRKDGKQIIKNILTFPPVLTKPNNNNNNNNKADAELFNLNVLVLDSVSRPHFYRSLPETVDTLRELFYDKSTKAAILEFEFLQSLSPQTFRNIRAFMSGQNNFHSKGHTKQEYGIETLFGKLKKLGYYTLLQMDECWLDRWGTILTNNVQRHDENLEELAQLWESTKKQAQSYFVDDYGMLFASCEVLKQYNVSSQYDEHTRKICYNGHIFPHYFFDYTSKVLEASRAASGKTPVFSYTHINIGHELTGTRIKQVDNRLADYLRQMANEEDTLTVIFSDRGPKTSLYSLYSVEGRYEIYDSFLFMVVPEKVARKLGPERIQALTGNQHRLLSLVDLHKAFMSIGDARPRSFRDVGVFAEIPEERSCADIKMQQGALCKCQGWETWFPDNDPRFLWIAEFILGQLNNMIQQEYLRTRDLGSGGFGRCQRLTGYKFGKIYRRQQGNQFLLSMDIIVSPMKQMFEVQVKYAIDLHRIQTRLKHKRGVRPVVLIYNRRVTMFRDFAICADNGVDVGLCVCDYMTSNHELHRNPGRKPFWRWTEINSQANVLEVIRRANSFGGVIEIENLHEDCLMLLTRKHRKQHTRVYEVANSCRDRSYVVHVLNPNSTRPVLFSSSLPFSIGVLQRTIHFLLSVYFIDEQSNNFSPLISFNTIKLRT